MSFSEPKNRAKLKKWPKDIQVGGARVKVYKVAPKNAKAYFQISDYSLGKRKLRTFASESKALAEAKRIARRISSGQVGAAQLDHKQASALARAQDLITPTGDPIELVAARYAQATALLGGNGDLLLTAVRDYAKRNPSHQNRVTTQEAVNEFIRHKSSAGLSQRYLQDLTSRLKRFAKDFPTSVSSVSHIDIENWLSDLGSGAQTVKNYRTVLHTFFGFCASRSLITENPVTSVRSPKVKAAETQIYEAKELRALLEAADTSFIPYLAIGAFAGLRTSEIERLDWSEVKTDAIVVSAGKAKTGSRRIVPLHENLKAILEPVRKESGPIWGNTHHGLYNHQQRISKKAKVPWKANALRHSYASYRLALIKDENQVSHEIGNTPKMVHRHYKALVSSEAAEEYFSITI